MSHFLGVDGGGTKTAFCVVTGQGAVVARLETRGCYYLGAGSRDDVALVAEVLGAGVSEVCDLAGITPADLDYAFFGLPTYGEVSADVPALDAAPRAVLGHDRYRCDNDMVCGWAGSLALADGINVISGTGSITYGQHGQRAARVGGWGELFGDEGSGYWIGVRGLQTFSQMSDGRLPTGPLLEVLRQHLDLRADLDLVDVVLNQWRSDRTEVAALSRPVVEAAHRGDSMAGQILSDAAGELLRIVEATRLRLGFGPEETVPVSYSGGLFSVPEVRDDFRRRLDASSLSYAIRPPRFSPVLGAALYASRLAGTPLGPDALRRLEGVPETRA
ncbi:MAG: BadF/BadG/BcrA/BcrD ATPase family protein [Propionibacteriaceae bacterium]